MLKINKKQLFIIMFIIVLLFTTLVVNNYQGIYNITKQKITALKGCVPVLAYHGFGPKDIIQENPEYDANSVIDYTENFEEQMKYLYDNGWTTLTMDEFYQWHQGNKDIPKKSCVITFDDGYADMYYEVYPILKKYNFSATCFVVGDFIPEITPSYSPSYRHLFIGWDKIKEIEQNYPKFQFESHSYHLHTPDENGQQPWISASYNTLKEDFNLMDKYNFEYMAYPYGGYNNTMLKAVKNSNIKMAFTFNPPGYATKNSPIYEIPRQKILGKSNLEKFKKILADSQF